MVPLAPAAPVIASTSPFADVNDSPTGTAFDTPPSAAGILVPAHSLHPFADDGQFYGACAFARGAHACTVVLGVLDVCSACVVPIVCVCVPVAALLESHEGGAAQRSFHIEHCSGCAFA